MSPPISSHSIVDDGVEEVQVEYAVALEYEGPPVAYDIPRALPIRVDTIPVASVVSHLPFTAKISYPVVQPLLAQDNLNLNFSKELGIVGSDTHVSPTSVIHFQRVGDAHVCEFKEADLVSDVSLSPSSVVGFAEIYDNCKDVAVLESSCSGKLDYSDSGGSGVLNDLKSSPELVSSSLSNQLSEELLGRAASSCTLDFCQSSEKSQELSGISHMLRDSVSFHDNLDYDDLNNPEWASSKSGLSLSSSAVSSFRTGHCNSMPNLDAKRTTLVTFRDVDSMDGADEEPNSIEADGPMAKKEPHVKSKKGACYRCYKGKRFTEKEVCIVCSAKYCRNCVLRAMGSMPEGRKCVSCIGCPIDEAKRGSLGKCSRMLKRLLNGLEIQQIMKAEKLCDVNQLPSEYIAVNGKPLCQEELVTLQNCPIPPRNLKPGNYWYDKVSGLWGKEAQKPYQIISPHLSVGDPIKQDASSGNTGVFINGREITKSELRMLQLAGVQCAGNPHFWVNEDGSYQEEGQKNTKGYIWGKAGTKLVCALLSLPVPSKSKQTYDEQVNYAPSRSFPDYFDGKMFQKLLLVGCSGSGTSTIFKQAKILYKSEPFSDDERESIKLMIQGNVYTYLGMLLEGRDRFEEECLMQIRDKTHISSEPQHEAGIADGNKIRTIYSLSPRLKSFSEWLLRAMASGHSEAIFPAATREYAPLVEELWNSAAFQAAYNRRSELEMLPGASSYFLERSVDILKADYEPSDLDILYAEGVTSSNGLSCVDFSFPVAASDEYSDATEQYDSMFRYQLVKVQAGGLVENCKWLEMFEDVRLVMFTVALSDYDEVYLDSNGVAVNKMVMAKKFFESIIIHPTFEHMDFLLVLNKYDVFEEKVEREPLAQCEWFEDFRPLISKRQPVHGNSKSINHNPPLSQLASHYVGVKFKRLFSCLTGKKLYVSVVKGSEANSVDAALRYASEIVKWEDERLIFSSSDYSAYSIEASSPCH